VGREQEGGMMDWLIDKVGLFNRWYDGQREPKRFLLFISVMALAVIPLQLSVTFGSPIMALLGGSLFGVMCFIAALRAIGLGGKHQYVAQAITGLFLFMAVILGLRFLL
jgi:hypothetical protein